MSTISDLPASAATMGNPNGNGGYQGGYDGQGREETIIWSVPWEDRFAFEAAVQGYAQTFTSGGATYTRNVPLQSPYNPKLYAVAVRFKSQGKTNVTIDRPYNTVVYEIRFGILPFGVDGDAPFQSLQAQGASRQITIPNSRYIFSNGEIVDHGIAVNHAGVTYQFTQHQVNDIISLENALLSLMPNPLNNAPVTMAGRTFPTGTLLFETYSTTTELSLFGDVKNSLSMTLNYSALPWNSLVRSDGVVDTLTPQQYSMSNFSALIS